MQCSFRLSNRKKITLNFIGLLLFGLLASILVSYLHIQSWQNQAIRDKLQLQANVAASDINRWVRDAKARVEHLAEWLATTELPLRDKGAWQQYLAEHSTLQQRAYIGYSLESDGYYITNKWPVPEGFDPRLRPWYQQGKEAMTTIVTKPYLNAESDPSMEVAIVTPVIRNGRFIGMAGDHISLALVSRIITGMDIGQNGHGFLIDQDEHIVVHRDHTKLGLSLQSLDTMKRVDKPVQGSSPLPMRLLESADNLYYVMEEGGNQGWSLVLVVPKIGIQMALLSESLVMLSHFMLVFLLVMLGFYLSNRHILIPLLDYMELDSVTLLPNKKHFKRQVKEEFLSTAGSGKLLIITLDNYHRVTATYSTAQVHLLQNQIKHRIQSKLSGRWLLGVFSESRYICYSHDDGQQSEDLLEHLSKELAGAYSIGTKEINCSFRIGVSCYPEHGLGIEKLIDNAFSALANISKQDKKHVNVFKPSINQRFSDELQIFSAMKTALRIGEFHMVYQPQYDLQRRQLIGAEALIRWHSSELGRVVSPAEFIPIAEDSELVISIGDYVIEAVLHQLNTWRQVGIDPGRISINVSPQQLLTPDFCDRLMAKVEAYQVTAEQLEIEITETSVLENPVASIVTLHRLKSAGFHIAIDDFGTGYSSLEYLNRMPIDKLKIDRSFIVDLDKKEKSEVIVHMIIAMANSLGLRVIAEGVETEDEASKLCGLGCGLMQGYLFARPMAATELEEYIKNIEASLNSSAHQLLCHQHSDEDALSTPLSPSSSNPLPVI